MVSEEIIIARIYRFNSPGFGFRVRVSLLGELAGILSIIASFT